VNNIPPRFAETDSALGLSTLEKFAEGWFLSCEIDQHSERTLYTRRDIVSKLLWFLRRKRCDDCGVMELRAFFAYLTTGHKEPGGRWGNPLMTKPVSPRTVKDYHCHLRTLFRWIVAEGGLPVSPMERIPVPTHREDQIETFTEEQIKALLSAAKRSRQRRRDEAIILFLMDTGVRSSELCGLCFHDVDLTLKKATVEGKGRKSRPVYFGKATTKALWTYLNTDGGRDENDPLFQSERGEALTRSGLQQLIERLGKDAQINGVRCSPHTFRHYFSITFLRNGGNQFTLMQLLGHTNLTMTARYVKIAQADAERQARMFSPADSLKKGGRGR
jgi:site-specific recombinase XerD